ncbi:hypothetical protein BDQ17DRAFT_1364729 [Cyathus striatus]|nr:hypothetical protein BDQ17DRAFT_1364729 [Cyathus striatus]
MGGYRLTFLTVILVSLALQSRAAVNFDQCMINVTQGIYGPIGLDSSGKLATNLSDATAVSYDNCIKYCGAGQEPFNWSIFSQQFSSWLLPWLALVSQLPFGTNDKLINLEAMLLTVGSPTLAAYSLALTVLNGRWVAHRFIGYRYPNAREAVRILSSLQQAPLRVNTEDMNLLASLIVLPGNDDWWKELVERLEYSYSWSISAASNMGWVIIAYIFTVIDSFTGDITEAIDSNGQGVGSLWLWLLPIVVGWLLISPKCDSIQVRKAFDKVHGMGYIAQSNGGPILARGISECRAIFLQDTNDLDVVRMDEQYTAPVYNYSRFLPWVEAVETILDAFRTASRNAQRHIPVAANTMWVDAARGSVIQDQNRIGNSFEVESYCFGTSLQEDGAPSKWSSSVIPRILIASGLALMLQWGTTGAAVIVVWFTPTRGLGCRSGSYIAYGVLSTLAWVLLATSSFLSHYATSKLYEKTGIKFIRYISKSLAVHLRRAGKFVAMLNAIWIVISCMFQFTNFFDRCYCNSSVFGLRSRAYNVILPRMEDLSGMRAAWIGGVGLAGGSAIIFIVFVYLLINPTLPE